MPGPGTHVLVSDKVVERLQQMQNWTYAASDEGNSALPAALAGIATAHPNYFALGAVGPDLFFFLPDFRSHGPVHLASPLIGVVHFLDTAYATLDSWILEDWERYFGPVSENVDEAISRMTGDLSSTVADIMGGLSSVLTNLIVDLAAQSHDWFGLFSLGLNVGYDDKAFFWSDMLHYRKTSQFAHSLWAIADEWAAKPDDDAVLWSGRLKAYALGYMTHVATDTTGHSFVNEKCGGPFRTHWQRHHLIENHIDAKTHDDEHGTEATYNMFTESAMHYRIAFADDGGDARARPAYTPGDDSIRGLYVRRRHLDLDSEMPEQLATLIFEAMDRTYDTSGQAAGHGVGRTTPDIIPDGDGRPDIVTIQETYSTMFRYLKMSTLDGFSHEKPLPPSVFPNLDFPQLTDPHDDAPSEADHDMSFWDLCLAIIRFILWLAAIAVWLATVLPAILLDLGTYIPRLLAYYTIQLPLYNMIKAERIVMVMAGYFHPMQDEIDLSLIQLGNSNRGLFLALLAAVDDILGQPDGPPHMEPVPDSQYPHSTKFEHSGLLNTFVNASSEEYHHPWQYPETPVELCPTVAGPWQSGDLPSVLLDDSIPADEGLIGRYAASPTPLETDRISLNEITARSNMGDPVNFSSFLMWQLARGEAAKVTDWNLDADRGYGYKCWDWSRHVKDRGGDHQIADTEGHDYMAPCTPPPQTEQTPGYDAQAPLKIHYLDSPNPGCDGEVECARRKPGTSSGPLTGSPTRGTKGSPKAGGRGR